jgi:ABC-type Zn uptake system ZnuABC Zn-binding protein ZnuA
MLSSGLDGIEAIEDQEEKAEELLESSATVKRVHGEKVSTNDDAAYQLVFDPGKNVTEFRIVIDKAGVYTFFTEHMPFEFEADEHFLKSLDRDDIEPIAQEPDTGHDHDHHHAGGDPHFWYDPNNVIIWTQNIAEALSEADPANSSLYEKNADAYIAELESLDIEIRQLVSSIPRSQRKLVQDHVALTYYADEYGFEIVGAVVPTVSDQAEPSARHIAELAEIIREEDAYVILIGGEVGRGMKNLANAVAEEVGRDVQILEYLHGSLSPEGSRGDNYLDFMRYNTELIVSALSR